MKNRILFTLFFFCPLISWGQSFEYPIPPDTILDRKERIKYITEHFWNERTITDTTNFKNPKLLLDYLYLLKQTKKDKIDEYVHSFVSLSCREEQAFRLILFWLDNILYDSSSAHYNEELYIIFMKAVVESNADSVMKILPRQRMEIMSKNRVGNHANNFSFRDKSGIERDLDGITSPLILLIFNNPDCSLCHLAEEHIANDEKIQALLNIGKLNILAITPDAEYDDWMKHKYPANWLVGYDMERNIYNHRLYDVQRLPCMYLLDKDKCVLLKEADYDRISSYLSEIFPYDVMRTGQ